MNPEEYIKLDLIDQSHWFYRGKRAISKYWINQYLKLQKDDLFLDAGCGSGRMVVEMSQRCRTVGLDDHQESIALAQPKIEDAGGKIIQTHLNKVGMKDGCATVVMLSDVLEHIPDDPSALQEIIRIVRPGGLILITVPALKVLWSEWDEALHHCRRYSKAELLNLFQNPEIEVLRCTYYNTFLLPIIFAIRMWRKIKPHKPGSDRAEDKIPHRFLNALLFHIFVKPACWRWFQPPLGVSLIAILRRKTP